MNTLNGTDRVRERVERERARLGGAAPGDDIPGPEGDGETPRASAEERPGPVINRELRLTEVGNAQRFACMHGHRLRYVQQWRQWLVWDGQRWKPDELGSEMVAAKAVTESLYAKAAELSNRAATGDEQAGSRAATLTNWARASSKASALRAMLMLAQSEEPLAAAPHELDRDQFALSVLNGTLDLRTGELRPHRQSDMITKLAPTAYEPSASAPLWERFLERVLPDPEVRAWIQRYFGYSLTGDVSEQVLAFAYGSGANGKSVLIDVMLAIIGDYGLRAAADLVLAKHGESHPTELADLDGKRLVVASEIEQGRAWAESTIKRITGDTTISARRMREDFYTFPATHKLVIAANTRPKVNGADNGIWRRMQLVPFVVTIPEPERDRQLVSKLLAEREGILAWAVRGCLAWQRDGLGQAKAVAEATADYRTDQDVLGHWIEEQCVLRPEIWTSTADLYESYRTWCVRTGRDAWTRDTFRERLAEREGIDDRRKNKGRGRKGIGLRSDRADRPEHYASDA